MSDNDTEIENEIEFESELPETPIKKVGRPKKQVVDSDKPKRTRTMTPASLEKLALARAKAHEKCRELGDLRREATRVLAEKRYTMKMDNQEATRVLTEKRHTMKMDKLKSKAMQRVECCSEAPPKEEASEVKEKEVATATEKKKKPKKKIIIVHDSDSNSDSDDAEQQIIYIPKKKTLKKEPEYRKGLEKEQPTPPPVLRQRDIFMRPGFYNNHSFQ